MQLKFEELTPEDADQFLELNRIPGLPNRLMDHTEAVLKGYANNPENKFIKTALFDSFDELVSFNETIKKRNELIHGFNHEPVQSIKVTKEDYSTHYTIPSWVVTINKLF